MILDHMKAQSVYESQDPINMMPFFIFFFSSDLSVCGTNDFVTAQREDWIGQEALHIFFTAN